MKLKKFFSVEDTKKVNAVLIKKEEDRVAAWLRRHTSLNDHQISREILNPAKEVFFEAGRNVGLAEAVEAANFEIMKARAVLKIFRWISLIVSVLAVAYWLCS